MKWLDIAVRNFGPFEGQHEPFALGGRGLTLMLGDNRDEPRMNSNGAGKSTVPADALDWVLFGKHPRGDAADAVVNERAGKDCEVVVRLLDDQGRNVTIARRRKVPKAADGPALFIDGAEVTTQDSGKTQERIEQIIGLDRDVFHAAVLFAQGDAWEFADATDSERKVLLTKIVPELGLVDECLERLEEQYEAPRAALAALEDEAVKLGHERLALHDADPRALAHQWDADRAQRRAGVVARLQQLDGRLAELTAAYGAFGDLPPLPPGPPTLMLPPELHALHGQRGVVQKDIGAMEADTRRLGAAAEAEKRALAQLAAQGTGLCSACKQPITKEHVESERQQSAARTRALDEEWSATDDRLRGAREYLQGLEQQIAALTSTWEQQKQAAAQQYHGLAAAHRDRAGVQHALQNEQRNHAQLLQQLHDIDAEQNPYGQAVWQHGQRLQAINARTEAIAAEVERVRVDIEHLDFWKTGLGARGLKSYILDSRIEEMSREANRWVQLLTGGTIWVRFETQREVGAGKKKKLVDTLNIRVFRHCRDGTTRERNFKAWSGGEKRRVALGIDFGLARLVASRATQSHDILILDEVFQKSLDTAGKEAVMEMLQELAAEKSSIFVIDHDERFQGYFEDVLTTTKYNDASTIVKGAPCRAQAGDARAA